jgi:hypothetical protein
MLKDLPTVPIGNRNFPPTSNDYTEWVADRSGYTPFVWMEDSTIKALEVFSKEFFFWIPSS